MQSLSKSLWSRRSFISREKKEERKGSTAPTEYKGRGSSGRLEDGPESGRPRDSEGV
jgi:hypothetical protein